MSAAPKDFEIALHEGWPVVYAADEAAKRAGLVERALHRARAALHGARALRSGEGDEAGGGLDDLAAEMLVDKALELLTAGSLLAGATAAADFEQHWISTIIGRVDWLVGERAPDGRIVPVMTDADAFCG